MEHILRASDVAAAIRDTLAGTRTKAQLAKWAHQALLNDDLGTAPYESRHKRAINAVVQRLMLMGEGPDYELENDQLQTLMEQLEHLDMSDGAT